MSYRKQFAVEALRTSEDMRSATEIYTARSSRMRPGR